MQWQYGVMAALVVMLGFSSISHRSTIHELSEIKAFSHELTKKHKKTQAAYDDAITKTVTEYDKQIQIQETLIASRDADIASGTNRLSIATSSCRVPESPDSRATFAEDRAELEPEAARRIIGITDEGDEALIRCNALIDLLKETVLK